MRMTEIFKILTTEWLCIPLVIWFGILLLLGICILRVRRFRIKFKDRDRQIEIQTDILPKRKKE